MALLKKMSCTLAILPLAQAAHAQDLSPAAPTEIVEGIKSCPSVTPEKSVETDGLEADGWHRATVKAAGKDVDPSLTFSGNGNLLLTAKINCGC